MATKNKSYALVIHSKFASANSISILISWRPNSEHATAPLARKER